MKPRTSPYTVEYYEGLVRKTAAMTFPIVEDEYEDIVQILRVKCWRALCSYDPSRSRLPVERYVFSCMRNQVKDLLKRKRRNLAYIEDQRRPGEGLRGFIEDDRVLDRFDARYLSDDRAFEEVEEERPSVPDNLTELELRVLALLYADYSQREAAVRLGLPRGEIERAVRSIRIKFGDTRAAAA